jgi:hypothetical protein
MAASHPLGNRNVTARSAKQYADRHHQNADLVVPAAPPMPGNWQIHQNPQQLFSLDRLSFIGLAWVLTIGSSSSIHSRSGAEDFDKEAPFMRRSTRPRPRMPVLGLFIGKFDAYRRNMTEPWGVAPDGSGKLEVLLS